MYLVPHRQRLDIPNTISILVGNAIHGEEAHARNRGNRLSQPLFLVLEGFIDHLVRGDVGVEVIRDKIVVTMLFDRGCQSGEVTLIAEGVTLDGIEDTLQLWIELEIAVEVTVAEILDVFGEIAEEEYVLFTDFTGNFDLGDLG